jgi:transposase
MEWPAPPSGVVGSPANQEEEGMDISVLGIDLGKNVCSVVGLDASGAVVMRRRMRRETLIGLAEKLPACIVGMEACCGSHHIGRVFASHGHDVRLMSPEYVRPYVKAQKNEEAHRLTTIPGFGPIVASALVAAVGRAEISTTAAISPHGWAWFRGSSLPGVSREAARNQQARQQVSAQTIDPRGARRSAPYRGA